MNACPAVGSGGKGNLQAGRAKDQTVASVLWGLASRLGARSEDSVQRVDARSVVTTTQRSLTTRSPLEMSICGENGRVENEHG